MFGRHPESVEMRMPAIVSAMLHVVLLGAAMLNLDFFSRPPLLEPEPIMVEFEAIDKKAAAPKVGNPPPQPWTVAVPVPSDRKAFNTTLFAIYPTRTQTPLSRQGGGWVNRTQRRAVEQPSSANQAPRSGVQDMDVDTIEHHVAETGIMS
jgi:hypothetical protein